MSIVTGNVRTHTGNHATITGNVDVLNANNCFVTGNVRVVNGNHNAVVGNVTALNGNHNNVTGDVERAAGNYNRINGRLARDAGNYNEDRGLSAADAALVVHGSGNNVVGFAPGGVSMSTTSDGTVTTVTRGDGWTSTRIEGPGGSIVNNFTRGSGSGVFSGGNISVGVPCGGRVAVGTGIAMQRVENGGVIHNVFGSDDDAGSSSSSKRHKAPKTPSGGVIHNVFVSGRRAVASSSSSSSSSRKRGASASPPLAKRHKAPVPPSIPNEASASPGEPVCVVCMDRAVATVNKPCRHACLCVTCARSIADEPKLTCPICRVDLTHIVRLHIAARGEPVPASVPSSSSRTAAECAIVAPVSSVSTTMNETVPVSAASADVAKTEQ